MRFGFLGTGTIAKALIQGLYASDFALEQVIVSPRNKEVALSLSRHYPNLQIARDNQEVVDRSDEIFICLPSQITKQTLQALVFKPSHRLISVVAMATQKEISEWTGGVAPVYRAVPLPFVAEKKGLTPFYPKDKLLQQMFDALGGGLGLDTEKDLALFMLAGSMMGVYYSFIATCQKWLEEQGLPTSQASAYLRMMFGNLSDVMRREHGASFSFLQEEYSTKGGTNALISAKFKELGGHEALEKALETGFSRIFKPV